MGYRPAFSEGYFSMSQVASFYVLPAHEVEDLVSAATANSLWDFLSARARESKEFFGPGSLFLDLDLFLMDANTMLFNLSAKELSDRLSKMHGTYKALFDHRAARKAISVLNETNWDEAAIRRFYEGEGRAEVDEDLIGAFETARDHALQWMHDVDERSVGLLSIG